MTRQSNETVYSYSMPRNEATLYLLIGVPILLLVLASFIDETGWEIMELVGLGGGALLSLSLISATLVQMQTIVVDHLGIRESRFFITLRSARWEEIESIKYVRFAMFGLVELCGCYEVSTPTGTIRILDNKLNMDELRDILLTKEPKLEYLQAIREHRESAREEIREFAAYLRDPFMLVGIVGGAILAAIIIFSTLL